MHRFVAVLLILLPVLARAQATGRSVPYSAMRWPSGQVVIGSTTRTDVQLCATCTLTLSGSLTLSSSLEAPTYVVPTGGEIRFANGSGTPASGFKWRSANGVSVTLGNGSETGNLYVGGNIQTPTLIIINGGSALRLSTTAAKPTCDAGARGTIWHEQGGTGVADVLYVCNKDAAEAYGWRALH